MALLNFGNAIASFGKATAALGLDSVKATLEQDKIRLAAELAADENLLSDERKAKSAIALAGKQGDIAATAATALVQADKDKIKAAQDFTASFADPNNKPVQDYLKGVTAFADADPAKRAQIYASNSAAALDILKTKNLTEISTAQKTLADATTPEDRAKAQEQLFALTTTRESYNQERAQDTAIATLAQNRMNSTQILLGSLTGKLGTLRGTANASARALIEGQIAALDDQLEKQRLDFETAFKYAQRKGVTLPPPPGSTANPADFNRSP